MKNLLIILLFGMISCNTQNIQKTDYLQKTEAFANTIQQEEIKEMLYTYASDEFMGREAGSEHEHIATEYIRDFYKKLNIDAAPHTQDYYQTIPVGTYPRLTGKANNVVAYIPGTDKADEVVVLSAHLDHLGIKEGKIYNGADDDGSGTIAIMNIAKAFKQAIDKGYQPRRTLVFLHVTGEEKGLYGSKYYTDNPLFDLDKTIVNLNIDMIGRVDDEHQVKGIPNYLYLIGSDMLSDELKQISEEVNNQYYQMEFDYRYDAPDDPNRFYYRSDHYNFAKNNIPVIFYFNGTHADYHQDTDTPEKIDYRLLTQRTKLIFATAWTLANREDRPKLN
ncbi:M28 family peptidase [Flavobacteriaceae bacterium Ap0902]|nr:M28 family peptidase [Flavobacteriaceae bacterium Ap0902]